MKNPKSLFDKIDYLENEATADIAFIASGSTLEEAFSNAGLALTNVIIDLESIHPSYKMEKVWKSEDLKGLLYDYLDDLIFLFDTEGILLGKIQSKILEIDKNCFELKITGEYDIYEPSKHVAKTHIKAMTFFGMEIKNNSVKVTLDL